MPGIPEALLVHIHGTIAHRAGWSPYDETRVSEDWPNPPVIAAVRAMGAAGYRIIFVSGRSEQCRSDTAKWIHEHVGEDIDYAALHMRHTGDTRWGWTVKAEIFDPEIRDAYDVVGAFDDRRQVVEMWRALGLTVFQVADGNF